MVYLQKEARRNTKEKVERLDMSGYAKPDKNTTNRPPKSTHFMYHTSNQK
jgi:hypothetical protein